MTTKKTYKIIVIGDSGVGKTCLTYRFCEGVFHNFVTATIGMDFRQRSVIVDGEEMCLQLWDTAGQERFRKTMVTHYYRNVDAVVFVYDISNAASFKSVPYWIQECQMNLQKQDIPRVLVGNKCEMQREVSTNRAQQLADSYGLPLFETSASLDSEADNVNAIFLTLAYKLKSMRPLGWDLLPTPAKLGPETASVGSQNSSTSNCC